MFVIPTYCFIYCEVTVCLTESHCPELFDQITTKGLSVMCKGIQINTK